jgi:NADPH2:quinone reductase
VHAIRINEYGGADAMAYQEVETPTPGPKECLVRIRAAGINFIDVYQRTGRYPIGVPYTPGLEAAGVVESVGTEVTLFAPGDRVGYSSSLGAYAEFSVVPEEKLIAVPDGVDDESAAAALLQGMTAHYLSYSTYPIRSGDTVLVHAAAGGVGLLLTQMAHKLGARVLATVSTEEKAELARAAGADEIIFYTTQDFEAEVKRVTNGEGLNAVYDSVGKTTFEKGLNCLKRRGYMVLFGASSGPAPTLDPIVLSAKGSIFLTRPTLFDYTNTRESLVERAIAHCTMIATGDRKLRIERITALSDASRAHPHLESRATTGQLLLIP